MSPAGERPTSLWEEREPEGLTGKNLKGVWGLFPFLASLAFHGFIIISVKHEWSLPTKLFSNRHAVWLFYWEISEIPYKLCNSEDAVAFHCYMKGFLCTSPPCKLKQAHNVSLFLKQSYISSIEKYQSCKFALIIAQASSLVEIWEWCNIAEASVRCLNSTTE